MALRVGIIGASGIGYVHACHYNELGARVVAVLCSSKLKAKEVAEKLTKQYSIKVVGFHILDAFLKEKLDAVSICTPPSLHIDHIKACFDKNIPVFCEKPLFWNKSMIPQDVYTQINSLESHENRRLFVNTSNTVFIDSIMQTEDKSELCRNLSFEFYTNGDNTGLGIAQDLFPHGLSLLIHILGDCDLVDFTFDFSEHTFSCKFHYGLCSVRFDFRENLSGPRHMRIGLNDNSYTRVQVGSGSNYEVYLVNDTTNEVIPSQDPFRSFISRFLDFVTSAGTKADDGFHVGALNLNLMVKCLNLAEKHI